MKQLIILLCLFPVFLSAQKVQYVPVGNGQFQKIETDSTTESVTIKTYTNLLDSNQVKQETYGETGDAVFNDYGWSVRSYDRDVFDIITPTHEAYAGTHTIGTPIYKDNTGKILGKGLVVEVTSAGYWEVTNPQLLFSTNYINGDVQGNGVFTDLDGVAVNNFEDVADSTFVAFKANNPYNDTAYSIEAAFPTVEFMFNLYSDASPTSGTDSFTVTSPVRIRILASPQPQIYIPV